MSQQFNKIGLLDHGYVQLVEVYGSDERVIEAARMSTDKGFQGWDSDAKLLAYLYNNKHSTPFEMAGAIIEVKAPLFVFREWHRHRTQSYNEMSARYVPLPDENYCPVASDILKRAESASSNKQARGITERVPTLREVSNWLHFLENSYRHAQQVYEQGLALGIPKELARLPVPVARYSKMRAAANLRNWLGFLTLRQDPKAQQEIRVYADAVAQLLQQHFPRTMKLYNCSTRP